MCTVSFLPLIDKKGFILTSNRDETPLRPTNSPQAYCYGNYKLIYPRDTIHGGTWITTSSSDYTLCLLNGAFEKHDRKESYNVSRGKIIIDFFNYKSVDEFVRIYSFAEFEPFTLIITLFSLFEKNTLFELRWDGVDLFTRVLDATQAYVWSSSTLYDSSQRLYRQRLFDDWLKQHDKYEQKEIIDFHKQRDTNQPEGGFLMIRPTVQTTSITSILHTKEEQLLFYLDIQQNKEMLCRVF